MASTLEVTVRDLEALLFVAERPLSRREIGSLCGIDGDAVDALLGDLEVALRVRGVRLAVLGDEVRLVTAPESGLLIGRYTGAGETRVSPAAMEALAIVAYRQPVTRGVIERIRGVDSDYVIRSLVARRLVVEQGRADTPGRPILYATGFEFLERFGLASLDELPPLDADVAARLVVPDAEDNRAAEPDPEAPGVESTDPDDAP
jgi:segregation and condensation protein B